MLLFSIITINLNNKVGLERTIQSVVNQIFREYEYIIIDGNSNDGSLEIIKKYQKYISKWKSEPDKGIYDAMNKAIRLANGKYLLFLNSGDYLLNDKVLEQVSFCDLKADVVCGNLIWKSSENEFLDVSIEKITFEHFFRASIPHPASFFRRELFNFVGFFNENLKIVADWEFYLRAFFIHRCSYKHINITISVFNTDGISSNQKYLELHRFEREKVLREMFPFFYEDYKELIFLKRSILVQIARKLHIYIKNIISYLKFGPEKK